MCADLALVIATAITSGVVGFLAGVWIMDWLTP